MTQLDDLLAKEQKLNDGLDAIGAALVTAATDQAKSFADLKALITSPTPPAPEDLTAALAAVDTATAKVQAAAAAVQALDTNAIASDPTVPTVTATVTGS